MINKTAARWTPSWRSGLTALALLVSCSVASAQAIDLSKPLGTPTGCQNQTGQKTDSEDMLLLTEQSMVTSTSTCTFIQKLTAPDGTIVATGLCSIQGEEGRSINQFSISRSKTDPTRLAIFDEYGSAYDEVAPCAVAGAASPG